MRVTHMQRRSGVVVGLLAVAIATSATVGWSALAQQKATGQQKAPAAPTKGMPGRTSDGQPDMQGTWGNAEMGTWTVYVEKASYLKSIGLPPLPRFIQSNAGFGAGPSMKIRETPMIDPPDAILPYQPWALERRNSVMKGYFRPQPWQMDTQTPGWPTGIPREHSYSSVDGDYGGPIHIMQPPGYVVFLYETHHEFRSIPLDGRPQPGQDIKMWEGSSRGKWEGNTLVVDVWNNNDAPRMTVIGDFRSDQMRATERWTVADKDSLNYQVTVTDPVVLTRPWTMTLFFKRAPAGTELMEYAGVEGSKGLFAIE